MRKCSFGASADDLLGVGQDERHLGLKRGKPNQYRPHKFLFGAWSGDQWVRDLDGIPEAPPQSELFYISDGTGDVVEKFVQAYQKGWQDLPPEYSHQLFLTMIGNVGNAYFYYLELEQGVAGIGTSIVQNRYAGLYGLSVLPKFRRMGFGSVLLQNEVSHVASLGSRVVFFQSDEATRDFYVKNGFDDRFSADVYLKP